MKTTTEHILEDKGQGLSPKFEGFDEKNPGVDPNLQSSKILGFGAKPVPESRWTAWFASTLMALQLLLSIGYLTGNFGGFIDGIMKIGVKHFNTYFWFITPVFNLSSMQRFNEITRGFRLPKFDDSGFLASPIQQYPIELLIFLVSIFVHLAGDLVAEKGSKTQGTIKNFRMGTSFAFMYQLLIGSCVCVYKVGGILAFGNLDYFPGARIANPNPTNTGNYTSPTAGVAPPTSTGISAYRAPTNSSSPDQ
jgi:hypothetical protein